MSFNVIILIFSATSFLFYGISSFYSTRMIREYARWGCEKFRKTIALLQILGAIGLLIGYFFTLLLPLISALFTLMMIVAIFVRIKIRDKLIKLLPAILYAVLNFIIFYKSLID